MDSAKGGGASLAFLYGRRRLPQTGLILLAVLHAQVALGAQLPYDGIVDSPGVISSCALLYDRSTKTYAPTVALQPGVGSQQVHFTFLDASRHEVGAQIVVVPPAAPAEPLAPLTPFPLSATFAEVHCGVNSAAGSSGGGALILGILGAGALAGIVAAHGGGGASNTSPSGAPTAPTARPTLTPAPTQTPTAPPSVLPTATPLASPSPSPTATLIVLPSLFPGPSPTPTAVTGSPSPTPSPTPTFIIILQSSPSPGPLIVSPASVQFANLNSSGSYVVTGSNCAGIAAIAPQQSATGQFSIARIAPGSCTFTIAGAPGRLASLSVVVPKAPQPEPSPMSGPPPHLPKP